MLYIRRVYSHLQSRHQRVVVLDSLVQVLAAQALQDFRDLNALVSLGLTVEEAVRRFAEEQNLDAEAILAGMAKAAARAGSDTGRPVESE